MGSLLASVRGIGALLWFSPTVLLNGQVNLLDLDERGTADRSPDVEIVPIGIEKMTYLQMVITLARNTRLYEFPYDWRRRIEHSARQLHEALVRWSSATPHRRFTLIGHSMGGLVARAYLALYPAEAERLIKRVIMIGTPLQGATAAALIFTGDTFPSQMVKLLHPDNDVIGCASRMPASYQLLPPPREQFQGSRPYPVNWDLYDARAWGLPCVRQTHLNAARRYHDLVTQPGPDVPLYQIAGCHRRTAIDVWRALDHEDGDESPPPTVVFQENGEDSGDDLVPLWSSRLEGVETYYVQESHSLLPGNSQVLDAVIDLVYEDKPALPNALPEPVALGPLGARGSLLTQVAELRQHIANGELSRHDIARVSFAR